MKNIYRNISIAIVLFVVIASAIQCSDSRNDSQISWNTAPIQNTQTNQIQEKDEIGSPLSNTKENATAIETLTAKRKKQIITQGSFVATNLKEGKIGKSKTRKSDSPRDNVFHIEIGGEVDSSAEVWLEYELYGVVDYSSIGTGINDNLSYGGLVVKKKNQWTKQRERVNIEDLKEGKNVIRFTTNNNDVAYEVKNIQLNIETPNKDKNQDRAIVVNQPLKTYFYEGKGYLKGFVQGRGYEKAKVYLNNEEVQLYNGSFEGLAQCVVSDSMTGLVEVMAVFEDGFTLQQNVDFEQLDLADYINRPNQTKYIQETQTVNTNSGISLKLNSFSLEGKAGSIKETVELSVTTLRSMDMPSMDAAMSNVTGEHDGYRLLPHGSTFQKALRIGIPYDTASLPIGYQASDIRTYFFDEGNNKWVVLPYDSVDKENHIVYSYTHHFTDFVNGVIKAPEAPQTSAYTPTSLKQLQAANPYQGVNVMSPPSVNNSGSANMSLPIEVPAGRNGMQPNLAISYSSDGGNGWMDGSRLESFYSFY